MAHSDGLADSSGPTVKTFGQRIRELRESANMSVRGFAKKIGTSAPFVSDIELGRRFPSEKVCERIATVLGVPVDDLRAYDVRVPLIELTRLSQIDPSYGVVLRKIADGEISPGEILGRIDQKGDPG